jgi:hypothetical protein
LFRLFHAAWRISLDGYAMCYFLATGVTLAMEASNDPPYNALTGRMNSGETDAAWAVCWFSARAKHWRVLADAR